MITATHINTALKAANAGGGLVMPAAQIAQQFNDAILNYGQGHFDTTNQVAALLSECLMESAYFRTTEEYTKNGRYAPYIGRTFIQITWLDNYRSFGKWCKSQGLVSDSEYFVKNPKALADTKWAAIGGVWYFTQVQFHGKPLSAYSDSIAEVGKAVNLGNPYSAYVPNGQAARNAAYIAVRQLGDSIVPRRPAAPVKNTNYKDSIVEALTRDGFINIKESVLTGNPKNLSVSFATSLDYIGRRLMAFQKNMATKTEIKRLEAKIEAITKKVEARKK